METTSALKDFKVLIGKFYTWRQGQTTHSTHRLCFNVCKTEKVWLSLFAINFLFLDNCTIIAQRRSLGEQRLHGTVQATKNTHISLSAKCTIISSEHKREKKKKSRTMRANFSAIDCDFGDQLPFSFLLSPTPTC